MILQGTGGQWGRKFVTSYDGDPAYAGANVQPDTRFDQQYQSMRAIDLNESQKNVIWEPIVNPWRKVAGVTENVPKAPSNTDPNSTEYQEWAMKRDDAINQIQNNSCGFVAMARAMDHLGIWPGVHPTQLMVSAAADFPPNDMGFSPGYTSFPGDTRVNLLPDPSDYGFRWEHFLNEVSHNLNAAGSMPPVNTYAMDKKQHIGPIGGLNGLLNLARDENNVIMTLVRVDKIRPADADRITINGQEKLANGLLTSDYADTSHWVLITGATQDNNWIRIYNPINNQVEYYSYAELAASYNENAGHAIRLERP